MQWRVVAIPCSPLFNRSIPPVCAVSFIILLHAARRAEVVAVLLLNMVGDIFNRGGRTFSPMFFSFSLYFLFMALRAAY